MNIALRMSQMDFDLDLLRAEIECLKKEIIEIRKETFVAAFGELCHKMGYKESEIKGFMTIARKKVSEGDKIPQQ